MMKTKYEAMGRDIICDRVAVIPVVVGGLYTSSANLNEN